MKRGWLFAAGFRLHVVASLLTLSLYNSQASDVGPGAPDAQTLKAFDVLSQMTPALTAQKIKRIHLGDIELSSGRIVVVDPLTLYGSKNILATTVMPGRYPVFVYAQDTGGGDVRVGLAELRFDDEPVALWKMAVAEGQDVTTLKNDEIFGYGVDAGLGSFMSPETLSALEADMKKAETTIAGFSDYYTDVLAKELEKSTPNAIIYNVPSSPQNKIAIFHSGWGDGFYPSYFGYNSIGKPVRLVTTFFVLEEES